MSVEVRRPRRAVIAVIALVAALAVALGGCQSFGEFPGLPQPAGQPKIDCGRFAGVDCNDLLEAGNDAVPHAADATPVVIAVDGACPPDARCLPSALGGETVAVIVGWSDGTVGWATIPLPADWPAWPAGPATAMDEPPPPHLLRLVNGG